MKQNDCHYSSSGSSEQESQMEFNAAQKQALEWALEGKNIFLSGVAGTGKTAVVCEMVERLKAEGTDIAVTSSTGITALNLPGGRTLHSFAGLGLGKDTKDQLQQKARKARWLQAIWRGIDTLLIDEISMVPPLFFEKLDVVARICRKAPYLPFGGLQVILVGDFGQLPYIDKDAKNDKPQFLFETQIWRDLEIQVCLLTQVFRQMNDPGFIELLQRVRVGELTEADEAALKGRLNAPLTKFKDLGIFPTHLFSWNEDVDKLNAIELNKLSAKTSRKYQMVFGCNTSLGDYQEEEIKKAQGFLQKNCTAAPLLELRLGAQVILNCNYRPEHRLVNGSRGVVVGFQGAAGGGDEAEDEDGKEAKESAQMFPVVQFVHMKVLIRPWLWKHNVADKKYFYLSQIPLKLAWSLTVHKSQGQSLDCCALSLDGRTVREDNMAYVALSRVRSLEGLSLLNFDKRCIRSNPRVTAFYESLAASTAAPQKKT